MSLLALIDQTSHNYSGKGCLLRLAGGPRERKVGGGVREKLTSQAS